MDSIDAGKKNFIRKTSSPTHPQRVDYDSADYHAVLAKTLAAIDYRRSRGGTRPALGAPRNGSPLLEPSAGNSRSKC